MTPEARRLALAIPEADWDTQARAILENDPACIEPVAAFYTDRARSGGSGGSRNLAQDPATLRVLLTSTNREAIATAEETLLAQIGAAIPTPAADRPRAPRAIDHSISRADAADDRTLLGAAINAAMSALETYPEHERSPLVLASLLLLDRAANDQVADAASPVADVLTSPEHPAFTALRRALKRDPSPAVRRIAWRALKPGPTAMASLERLGAATTAREHEAVLELAHLLMNPARADLLSGLGAPRRTTQSRTTPSRRAAPIRNAALAPLLPPVEIPLAPDAERGLASLLARADTATARTIHDRVLSSPSAHARLTAARHADSSDLGDYALDQDASIAALATLRRSPVGLARVTDKPDSPHRLRHTTLLTRSPHAAVRSIAKADLDRSSLLSADGHPTVRAIALAQRDPDRLDAELERGLHAPLAADRVRTIRAAVRLGIASRWQKHFARIIDSPPDPQDPEPARVAATAAAALGFIPSRTTLPVIFAALDRPDPRVRANAVESLERVLGAIDADPTDRLVEIKGSPEHRARANAIRAIERLRLADDGSTHDELSEMLTDIRAPHRLAGVWLAERLLCDPRRAQGPGDPAWQNAARGVASLARQETEPHIRARATRCARRLLAEISRPSRAGIDPAVTRTARQIRALAKAHAAPDSPAGTPAGGRA